MTFIDAAAFWSKVSYGAPGGCWLWTGTKNHDGYGKLRDGRPHSRAHVRAHRVAYALAKPSMYNPTLHVLHTCDVPACCRPSHLFQGTQLDNIRDMHAKGRGVTARGEANIRAKLTVDQVLAIRADTRPKKTLARVYGISRAAIQFIKNRKTWRHV
jgi:hypothetical protein